jgi:hypothetical protein
MEEIMVDLLYDFAITLCLEKGEGIYEEVWRGVLTPADQQGQMIFTQESNIATLKAILGENLHEYFEVTLECQQRTMKTQFFFCLDDGPSFGTNCSSKILAEEPGKTLARFRQQLGEYIQKL